MRFLINIVIKQHKHIKTIHHLKDSTSQASQNEDSKDTSTTQDQLDTNKDNPQLPTENN